MHKYSAHPEDVPAGFYAQRLSELIEAHKALNELHLLDEWCSGAPAKIGVVLKGQIVETAARIAGGA